MKIQHALVPLDHSELAEVALDYARLLVAPRGRITLLMVVETHGLVGVSMYSGVSGNAPGAMMLDTEFNVEPGLRHSAWATARQYLDGVAESLIAHNYSVEIRLEDGSPAERILDVADESEVDAIVMSTHGRSGLSRWVMGSVAQKVVCAAACPVFLVPRRAVALAHDEQRPKDAP